MPIPSPLSRPSPSREDVTSPSSTAGGGGSLVALLSDISEGPTFSEPFEKFQSPICSDDEDDFLDDEEWFESEAILFDISDLLRPDSRAEVLKEIRNRMKAHLTPKRILLRDKITFTLGTLDLFLSAYWLGHSPETYGLQLYSVKVCVLLLTR